MSLDSHLYGRIAYRFACMVQHNDYDPCHLSGAINTPVGVNRCPVVYEHKRRRKCGWRDGGGGVTCRIDGGIERFPLPPVAVFERKSHLIQTVQISIRISYTDLASNQLTCSIRAYIRVRYGDAVWVGHLRVVPATITHQNRRRHLTGRECRIHARSTDHAHTTHHDRGHNHQCKEPRGAPTASTNPYTLCGHAGYGGHDVHQLFVSTNVHRIIS